jgi:hypothetical protein
MISFEELAAAYVGQGIVSGAKVEEVIKQLFAKALYDGDHDYDVALAIDKGISSAISACSGDDYDELVANVVIAVHEAIQIQAESIAMDAISHIAARVKAQQ